jgi:murein DD-endopeptidase MepM/ murein hydrolase activator NlpD
VVYVGRASGGFCGLGRIVIVDAGNGYKWMAAHLQSITAYVGQSVSAGNTAIGTAGGSGCTSDSNWGTHLHSGLYYNAIIGNGGLHSGQSAKPLQIRFYRNGGGSYTSFYRGMPMSY